MGARRGADTGVMMLDGLRRRVGNMLLAAILTADTAADGQHRGTFRVRAGEVKGSVRILTPYGFAISCMPVSDGAGPESVILAVESDLRYATAPADRRYAPDDLEQGDVALYSHEDKMAPCRIHFKAGRVIKIQCDTAQVEADTLINLAAPTVRLAATQKLTLDAGGYGFIWQAVGSGSYQITNYTTGSVSTATVQTAPPALP